MSHPSTVLPSETDSHHQTSTDTTMQNTKTMAAPASERAAGNPSHTERVDFARLAPGAVRAQLGLETYVRQSGLEPSLLELVRMRASVMNGCAYCVDMH